MESQDQHAKGSSVLELLLSTTTGIFYGFGIALLILLLFVVSLDQEMLSSLTTIFFGSSI